MKTKFLSVLLLCAGVLTGAAQAATLTVANGDVAGLIAAINAANANRGADTIELASNGTYALSAVNNTNNGPTGLPIIFSAITVNGNGAVIERSSAEGTPEFRLLDILSSGNVKLNELTLRNGHLLQSGHRGGAISNQGTLSLGSSTISGNSARDGGGISNQGTLTVTDSTFVGNRASGFGGGIDNGNALSVISSTFSGNSTDVFNGGGGISNQGTATMRNTLLANERQGGNCASLSIFGTFIDGGANLDDGSTCGFLTTNNSFNSFFNTNPLLDPAGLKDNGGPTETIGLQPGSPAIDAIPQGTNGCGTDITKDQRGVNRPVDGNGDTVAACDIGAVEADTAATAAGTLQFVSAASDVGEDGVSITIPIGRIGGSNGEVSVSYTTGGGTATDGADYTFTSGSLTWANGDNSVKTVTLPIIDDSDFEGDETVNLTLSSPTGTAALGTPASATITIHDDETTKPGTLSFSATNYEVGEDAAIATITVTRSGGGNGEVSIDYATNTGGTATAGADYTETSGTLIWVGGDITNKTFSVPINDDTAVEGDERVSLTLGNPTPGVTFGTAAATLTIRDNDVAHPGSLQFSAAAYSATEGDGSAQIIVRRMDGGDGAVSVDYATGDGTATAGSDYTAASGTLTWSDGDTADKFFSVPVIDDTKFENDETVNLSLSTITGDATLSAPTAAVLTIADNDSAQPGSLQFSATAYSVNEGGGSATITVTRAGGSDGQVSVTYTTSNGTATEGADYTFTSGFLTWADGDTADKSFSIPVINDTDVEGNETLNLSLSNPDGGASLGSPTSAVLTIVDNDVSQQRSLRFSVASYGVNEGAGTAVITVTRAGGTVGRNSVRYSTAPGTATAGSDYKSKSGTLTWANGETASKSFSVSIIDDTKVETDETLNLRLSAPSNGAILGVPSSATLTITDNEGRVACEGLPATIVGTAGADNLKGTAGPDVIVGLDGVDVISGLGGDDVICGGIGNDNIIGGAGNDRLFGEAGDDLLAGSGGVDLLDGGADQDQCDGGAPRIGDTASNCEIIANVP